MFILDYVSGKSFCTNEFWIASKYDCYNRSIIDVEIRVRFFKKIQDWILKVIPQYCIAHPYCA